MTARFILAQVSARTTHPDDPVRSYYHRTWARTPGYVAASHDYLELPTWAAEVAGILPAGACEFRVLRKRPDIEALRLEYGRSVTVFGSVLDVSLSYWRELTAAAPCTRFILGGYVPTDSFADRPNVLWLDCPADIARLFDGCRSTGPDYSIFAGTPCIPRLRLSTGCRYRCSFCTVPRRVVAETFASITRQVDSFEPLSFELVYLDDKTFGQANTAELLPAIADRIRSYNPAFRGFIVQSTASEIVQHAEAWTAWGVKYIELGVETLEPEVLRQWHKPHGPASIEAAAAEVRRLRSKGADLWLIPNIIFGYEHADYTPTLAWLRRNADISPFINPYILCQYHDSKGTVASETTGTNGDTDEGSWNKTWLTDTEAGRGKAALTYALNLHEGG